MFKGLVALCIVSAVQVCSAYEVAVPVFQQPRRFSGISRIIGGQTATRGQFPHQAAIAIDDSYFCGGSLIAKNWVLTAAHCIYAHRSWRVSLGAHNIRMSNEPGRVTVISSETIQHEGYATNTDGSDLGLIRLPQDVQFSDYINIINLPPRSFADKNLVGQTVRVSGWGVTSGSTSSTSPVLKFVDLTLISLEECTEFYGSQITQTMYCCSAANAKSTCDGDSGGALTIGSGTELYHLGIVSFGSPAGCDIGHPVGFTATPHFVDWISDKTGIHAQH